MSTSKDLSKLARKKTRVSITSGGNEPVVDSDGGDHSLFALKLIDTFIYNVGKGMHIKNRLSCKFCPYTDTKHCT